MCVIVHQPIGQNIDKATAEKLWKTNPDGGGFAYVDDKNQLQIFKTMHFSEYWKRFETARSQNPGRDFLLHMRIATHGSVNINNVHPFVVDDHTVMAHNGILHGVTPYLDATDDRSDTLYFVQEVLPRLPETWLDDPFITGMVDDWIGWSKLMFLTTNPKLSKRVYRLGDWKEYEGLPVSNTNGLASKRIENRAWEWTSTPRTTTTTKKKETKPSEDNIYQLPLPKESSKSSYRETSEEWEFWLAYKESEFKDFGEDVRAKPLDAEEFNILLEAVKEERANHWLLHPLVVIDRGEGQIECSQCLGIVDLETADCHCWAEVCGECWNFLALCKGSEACGDDRSFLEFDSLSERGKEFVNAGGMHKYAPDSDDRKILAKALAQGARNTKKG